MALGVSHAWSWAASGCSRKSFLVRFLYASKALFIIGWNLDDEDEDDAAVG